jgi:gliding motility-associated-like protein
MSMKNYLLALAAYAALSVSIAQEASKGMELKPYNFTSFTEAQISKHMELWIKLNKGFEDHPELGVLPKNAPCEDCIELLGKRTSDTRHYLSANDTTVFFVQRGNQPLHFEIDGFLRTIDHRLKKGNIYSSSNFHNTISIRLGSSFSSDQGMILMECAETNEHFYFNNWKLFKSHNGKVSLVAEPNWKDFSAGEDGVFIQNIFPGIDAEFIVQRGALKTNFIVKSTATIGDYDELLFVDEIEHMFDAIHLSFENDASAYKKVGNVHVKHKNNILAKYGEGIAYGQNNPKNTSVPLVYSLNKNKLNIHVDEAWLTGALADGNVVIDPLVTGSNTLAQAAITGSFYNTSCGFDNSCNYNLIVPAPANATFNDVFWSFEYIAQGLCWLNEGATRFATGTCLSPSQTGFFWFCNQIGNGTCAGNNVSVFNDLGACLPSPSCNPQNVEFTLQFFRSCWGPVGCDNSCIGANSPWTMTIQGQTIAYSNVTNPITVSSTTVCQGDAISATTSGQNGVPPYTYEWSFDPSGNPVVATGASANITFPTAGNVTLYSIVTDACGNEVVESVSITVEAAPSLTVSATNTEICQGQSTTISASGGGATYNWDNGLGAGASHTVSPSVTTTYNVTSASASGCPAAGNIQIIVNPLPTVNAGADITICQGDEVTLNASGNATTYTWSGGAVNGVPFVPPIGVTTYTVTGNLNGCQNQDNLTVTVQPEINFSLNGASPSGCGISDGQITLSNLPPNQTIQITYTYNGNVIGPTNYTVDGTGNAIIPNLLAGNYSNFIVNLNNCISQNNSTVTLIDPNAPTISVPNDQVICQGDQITLSATVSGGNVTWTGGISDGVPFTPPAGTTTYTATVNDNGCTNSASVTITVNELSLSIDNVQQPSCFGSDDGTATAIPSGGNDPFSFQWSPTGGSTANGSGLSAGVYTVTVTDANGCSATETVTLTNPDAIVLSAASTASECGEETGSASITATGGAGNFSYNWSPNVSAGNTANDIAAGDYEVTVTDANGCSEVINVTVEQLNSIDVFIIPDNAIIDFGQSVVLTVETDPVSTIINYSWIPATGLSCTNCASPTASPGQTTVYTVNIITDEGCTGQTQALIQVIRECEETFIPTIFSPNNDGINDELCIIGDCVQEVVLNIYNRWGERVYQTTDPTACWRGNHRGTPVNTGVYTFKANIILIDGTEIEEAGNITLIR